MINNFVYFIFPGADDVISFTNDNFTQNFFDTNIAQSNLINELTSRDSYDVIFLTTKVKYKKDFLQKFLTVDGKLIDTVEPDINSDSYGAFMRMFYSLFIRLKKFGSFLLRCEPDWGGPHLCHLSLDRLAG